MGIYLNPPEGQAEWLAAHGTPVPHAPRELSSEHAHVCLLDNGAFLAAAVMYEGRELQRFTRDSRVSGQWFSVAFRDVVECLGFNPFREGVA